MKKPTIIAQSASQGLAAFVRLLAAAPPGLGRRRPVVRESVAREQSPWSYPYLVLAPHPRSDAARRDSSWPDRSELANSRSHESSVCIIASK